MSFMFTGKKVMDTEDTPSIRVTVSTTHWKLPNSSEYKIFKDPMQISYHVVQFEKSTYLWPARTDRTHFNLDYDRSVLLLYVCMSVTL